MRLPRLLFLVLFVADGILLQVATLDLNDVPSSNLTTRNARGLLKHRNLTVDIRKLDNHSGEERGAAVFESILQKIKQFFDKLFGTIRSLFGLRLHQEKPLDVTPGHLPAELDKVWLDLEKPPEEVLAMVQSREDGTILWLQYTMLFKEKNGDKTFSDDEMKHLLLSIPSPKNEVRYANLFAEMGSNGLGDLAESMQRRRFHDLIVDYGMTPSDLERNLHPHGRLPTSLSETDPLYGAYKAFALEFAAVRSPSTQKELEQYFLAGDRIGADKYLAKLENSAPDDLYPYHELTDDQRKAGE